MPPPLPFCLSGFPLNRGTVYNDFVRNRQRYNIESDDREKFVETSQTKRNHAPHSPLTFFFWGGESMNHMKIPSEGGSKFDKLSKRKVMSGI